MGNADFRASRLPDTKRCVDCCNYQNHCRFVLAGEHLFDGLSRHCYWGAGHFDVPLHAIEVSDQGVTSAWEQYRNANPSKVQRKVR